MGSAPGTAEFKVKFNNFHTAERALGDLNELTVAPNTKLIRLSDGDIGLQFYETLIVQYFKSHNIIIDLSYNSVTTRGRIKNAIPSGYRVHMVNKKIRLTRIHDGEYVEAKDDGRAAFGITIDTGELMVAA